MTKTAERTHVVTLDYPQQNEIIISKHYSFRISASEGVKTVAISIDGCEPVECRQAAGYFWYDWSEIEPGKHDVYLVAEFEDGTLIKTKVRRVAAQETILLA